MFQRHRIPKLKSGLVQQGVMVFLFMVGLGTCWSDAWEVSSPTGNVVEIVEGVAGIRLLSSRTGEDVVYSCWLKNGPIAAKAHAGSAEIPGGDASVLEVALPLADLKIPVQAVLRLESKSASGTWSFLALPEGWTQSAIAELTAGKVYQIEGGVSNPWSDFFIGLGVVVEPVNEADLAALPARSWVIAPEVHPAGNFAVPGLCMLVTTEHPADSAAIITKKNAGTELAIPAALLVSAKNRVDRVWMVLGAMQILTQQTQLNLQP